MKIYRKYLLLTFLLLSTFSLQASKDNILNVDNASMDEIVKKAGLEGKLIMIDFYADWCTPCKWMDQTVFNNTDIVTELNANYISKKVNIDDIDGFELKKRYNINVLPSILLFNTEGKIVERIEKTVNVSEFLDILKLHNTLRNKVKIKHSINTSPTQVKTQFSEREMQETYLRYIESNATTERNYRLQLGVYNNYELAFDKVKSLKKTFLEPIIVINDYKDNEVRFKVMMGEFPNIEEADGFRKILKSKFSLDAIVN